MNKEKVYLKGYVIGHAADTLGYQGLMVQLENLDIVEVDKNLVHKQLDEPQKPVVPQFVADWYEENKENFETNLLDCIYEIFKNQNNKLSEFEEWVCDYGTKPFQILVNMHQLGYTVEKEKRYLVKIIGVGKLYECLNFDVTNKRWIFFDCDNTDKYRTHHTHKELEEAGFGWVFDCPGIEIEEVTE